MKKFLAAAIVLLLTLSIKAQPPQGISYQAIAFNTGGTPVASTTVGIKISILNGSASGTVAYAETHTPVTNAQGLFNIVVGQGSAATGTFANINWKTGDKFLKVEIDPAGGTNYTTTGTSQLLSVPYAFYAAEAGKAATVDATGISGVVETDSIGTGVLTSSYAYAYSNHQWYQQSLSGTAQRMIATRGNFGVMTTSYGYAFAGTQWYSQSLSGTSKEIRGNSGNVAILTSSYLYAFDGAQWHQQSLNGTTQQLVVTQGTFGALTSSYAYAFSNGQFYSQSLSGTAQKIIGKNGKLLVYTSSYAYTFDSETNQWHSQSLNGSVLDYAH